MFSPSVPPSERYKSENLGEGVTGDRLVPSSSAGTRRDRSNFTSVGSAEALRQGTPWEHHDPSHSDLRSRQKKMLSFSNPFDPNKIHSEAPAFQRRWAHVFPTNKRGVAFQTHHETEGRSLAGDHTPGRFGSAASTPRSSVRRKGILKTSVASSPAENRRDSLAPAKDSPLSSPRDVERRGENTDRDFISVNWPSSIVKRDNPVSESGSRTHTPVSSHRTSTTTTPEFLRQQRWTAPPLLSSSAAEDFASVRRTGVDWTSLVEPAHLPVTTDFYPAREILDRDYAQYNSSLVVFREEQEQIGESSAGGSSSSEKRLVHDCVECVEFLW